MLRDKLTFGALAGICSVFVMEVPEIILWKLNILPHPLFHLLGSLFMPVDTLHHMYLGELMGFVASKVYGALLGVVFIYLLVFTGHRFFVAKGLIYGAAIWLLSYGGLASIPMVRLSVHQRMPLEILLIFFLHLLYGLTLGVFVRTFGRELGKDS